MNSCYRKRTTATTITNGKNRLHRQKNLRHHLLVVQPPPDVWLLRIIQCSKRLWKTMFRSRRTGPARSTPVELLILLTTSKLENMTKYGSQLRQRVSWRNIDGMHMWPHSPSGAHWPPRPPPYSSWWDLIIASGRNQKFKPWLPTCRAPWRNMLHANLINLLDHCPPTREAVRRLLALQMLTSILVLVNAISPLSTFRIGKWTLHLHARARSERSLSRI